jgi:molybdopterin molybdotransferase
MLAASMNHATVPVHRKPKVAIAGTGDELVAPGSTPGPGQIVYSNGFALTALAQSEGAQAIDIGIVHDRVEDIAAAIHRARDWGADILVTTGGASVGEHDLVQRALKDEGLDLSFWRVALRPGRPMMHGKLGGMQVLGLPGNPVSSYVCALLFAIPLLRLMQGRTDTAIAHESAILGSDLTANDERADYMRALLTSDSSGQLVATPFPVQDSSTMGRLSRAGCLIVRPAHDPAVPKGGKVSIVKLPL